MIHKIILVFSLSLFIIKSSIAQDGFEIQVYGSPTLSKDTTMVELHSNFTFDGEREIINEVKPSNHLFHETIEISHGFTNWMELACYFFNTIGDNDRTTFVGSHIRPKIMAPVSWNLPLGLALSTEFGYQKREYSEDDWCLEIRPIMDKKINKLYLAFNPTFDKSLHGINKDAGFIFSPNFKVGYEVTKKISVGLEYYGSIGPLDNIPLAQQQQHQLFLVTDIEFSELWEFNLGYGIGLTDCTDNSIIKFILGRKFGR